MINDIERHCMNKRKINTENDELNGIKKRNVKHVFKMDVNKFYKRTHNQDNSVTLASSDYKKLPRVINDPIIDYQFKVRNKDKYAEIMEMETENVLRKYMNPDVVYQQTLDNKVVDF